MKSKAWTKEDVSRITKSEERRRRKGETTFWRRKRTCQRVQGLDGLIQKSLFAF